jgi:hypothetical protein
MPFVKLRRAIPAIVLASVLFSTHSAGAQQSYDPASPPKKATASDAFGASQRREFFIATVHLDGRTGNKPQAADPTNFFPHPAEEFPTAALPGGGGLILKGPLEAGTWQMRAFLFVPAQIVVTEGDTVVLNFIGTQGPSHRIAVEGRDGEIVLKRGEMKSVVLEGVKPGVIRYASLDRLPSMVGEVLVLAKK